MTGNPAQVWDYVDLALLHLAKVRRRKLSDDTTNEQFYEEFFNDNDYEVMGSGGDLRRQYRGEVLRAAAWARMEPGARVLDVGCGTGDNLRCIWREDARFFGLEYSAATTQAARRLLGDRADVQVGSATEIPFEDASVDLALCIEVLEHIDDHEKALAEIWRVLRPGAHLILAVPFRHWFKSYLPLMGHHRHYTRRDVETMLAKHGFEIADYLPNTPDWARFANYSYIGCRIWSLALRGVGRRYSPVEVPAPFSDEKLLELLFRRLEPSRLEELKRDYSSLPTSTFVVARKP